MNLLIIDDQPNILSSLVSGIPWVELGFQSVFTAQNARYAREIMTNNPLDLVISDIEMPGEDGISLLRWAREKGMEFDCILLTAHADFAYAQQAISLQVADYIIQPARNEDVTRSVRQVLKKRKDHESQLQSIRPSNYNYAAQNIVIQTMFEEWPPIESSIVKPSLLEDRLTRLKQFGIPCSAQFTCVVSYIHIHKWRKLPLTPTDFLDKYLLMLHKELKASGTDVSEMSYYNDKQEFFTVYFGKDTDRILAILQSVYQQIELELGAITQILYAPTEIRFLRNTMDGILTYAKEYANSHFEEIQLLQVDRDTLIASATGSDNYRHYNEMIHAYIDEHIGIGINRSDIAEYLQVTPDQVSHIIKVTEQLNIKEFITKKKMEHARNLLQNTQYPISDVARKCGYDSFAYFSKVYRETYGVTPSTERQ